MILTIYLVLLISLLVLDEVDQLDTRTQHVLYSVFEWPSLHNSHLILISKSLFNVCDIVLTLACMCM